MLTFITMTVRTKI